MRLIRTTLLALSAALLSVAFSPGARADEWDKKTVVTFDQEVAIPGQVLPPGTYVFKLLGGVSDRNVVQVWDADESHLITMLSTVGEYTYETPDRPTFILDTSKDNEGFPPALVRWFYPGDNTGWGFVYSNSPSHQ
jgi:hypothetical protein